MRYRADLHVHSRFSRATSKDLSLEDLWIWAQKKGLQVVGTGDITHPGWFSEVRSHLTEAEEGLFSLQEDRPALSAVPVSCRSTVRFILSGEISNIYKRDGKVRKVHNLVLLPDLGAAERFGRELARVGNVASDGRPILGLDSRDLFEILLSVDERSVLIPAHIWTPWFSVLGSKSGFDAIEACYGDLSDRIFALETGLSSDPAMNWRLSGLDRYALVSNSDAHSAPNLGREACVFDAELSYPGMMQALRAGAPPTYLGTIEFFPEEGKYHWDGHRKCGMRLHPAETRQRQGKCPGCGKAVTVGVLSRVEELADRGEGQRPERCAPYRSLVSLPSIVGDSLGVGPDSKKVREVYEGLLSGLGPEIPLLLDAPLEEIRRIAGPVVSDALSRVREGRLQIAEGYDGEYGQIHIFTPEEREVLSDQLNLVKSGSSKKASVPGKKPRPLSRSVSSSRPEEKDIPQEPSSPGGLNERQAQAATTLGVPVLIVAGPGTGKTLALTHRIAHLIRSGADPSKILAVTFTNEAALEMRSRLQSLTSEEELARMTVSTFHGLGLLILKSAPESCGLKAGFRIAEDEEIEDLFVQIFPGLHERKAKRLREQISSFKGRGMMDPDTESCLGMPLGPVVLQGDAALHARSWVDLDDLLSLPLRILESETGKAWRSRFSHICVDEYQDINRAQYLLLRELCGDGSSLCVIGDPHQAIYSFRGSDPSYFSRFKEEFPQAIEIHLDQNYRSSDTILAASRSLLPGAEPLIPHETGGVLVSVHEAATEEAEAEWVVQEIERMVGGTGFFSMDSGRSDGQGEGQNLAFSDVAILMRTRRQAEPLREALSRSGMPFEIAGENRVSDMDEAKILRMLILLDREDREELQDRCARLVWGRAWIDKPKGELLKLFPKRKDRALSEWLLDLGISALPDSRLDSSQWQRICQAVAHMARTQGEDPAELLRVLSLQREIDLYDPRAERIALLTLHASKGLEFSAVFIVGCEEGLLPLPGAEDVEEERRLFYVGITRARHRLFLTRARKRSLWKAGEENGPSRFLADIDSILTETRKPWMRETHGDARRQMKLF